MSPWKELVGTFSENNTNMVLPAPARAYKHRSCCGVPRCVVLCVSDECREAASVRIRLAASQATFDDDIEERENTHERKVLTFGQTFGQ